MNPNDPAFARTFSEAERRERVSADDYDHGHAGMSLRAYFAAHAPAAVPEWFEALPPTPRPAVPNVPDFPLTAAGQKQAAKFEQEVATPYRAACLAWDEAHSRQRAAQWPWAWADLVLSAGGAR